ncbi:MAG: tetratricopeptide repeat protein [Bacteroidota bacterium]
MISKFGRYCAYFILAVIAVLGAKQILVAYWEFKGDFVHQKFEDDMKKWALDRKRDSVFYVEVNELVESKKYDEAISILNDSLKSIPNIILVNDKKASLLVDIGDVYQDKGELTQAFQSYEQAIDLDSTNIEARVRRGEINYFKNNLDAAIVDYKVAARGNFDFYYFLGIVQAKRGYRKDALASLNSYLKQYPQSKQCKFAIDSIMSQR